MAEPDSRQGVAIFHNRKAAILSLAAASLLFVSWRAWRDWHGRANPFAAADSYVRNSLFLLVDEMNRGLAAGTDVEGVFRAAAAQSLRIPQLSDGALFLTPEEGVYGPTSALPRMDRLDLWGDGAPVPSKGAGRNEFRIVLVRPLPETGRVRAWSITQDRELSAGTYWLVPLSGKSR